MGTVNFALLIVIGLSTAILINCVGVARSSLTFNGLLVQYKITQPCKHSLSVVYNLNSDHNSWSLNSLNTRYAIRRQFIKVSKRPDTPYGVLTRKACKTSVMFVLHEQKNTCGLLRHSYSYIYTQETGTLKAMGTTGMFFVIGRVILSIDDRHISPCNSLLVYPVSTKSI